MAPTKEQIKLIQTAVRAAGLRSNGFEGRYRLLLGRYLQPDGSPVTSCKQLNNAQIDDLLAICEAQGWRCPGKPDNYYRKKAAAQGDGAGSYAQLAAIRYLAGDLGWNTEQLLGFIKRLTGVEVDSGFALSARQAYNVVEALKAILSRRKGRKYENLQQVKADLEATDGESQD